MTFANVRAQLEKVGLDCKQKTHSSGDFSVRDATTSNIKVENTYYGHFDAMNINNASSDSDSNEYDNTVYNQQTPLTGFPTTVKSYELQLVEMLHP